MPVLDLTDEELQGLIMVCANASGPGVSWMLTNALLTKAQQAAQTKKAEQAEAWAGMGGHSRERAGLRRDDAPA